MPGNEKPRYSMTIQWSNEDSAYLVTLPEWTDNTHMPATHGDTYEEAAKNGREVLEMLCNSAQEQGEALPDPDVYVSEEEANKIDRKWDELLASPESQAHMKKMAAKIEADMAEGRVYPGGFGGSGEFTDELEAAMKALIGRMRQGVMECDQHDLAVHIGKELGRIEEKELEELRDEEIKEITASTGNVFADLGLPDPEDRMEAAKKFKEIQGNNGDFSTFYQGYKAGKENAKIAIDPDNPPLTKEDFARMESTPHAKIIRRALGLSQQDFAARYHIPLETLQEWEEGRTTPSKVDNAYLRAIATSPDGIARVWQKQEE